MLMIGIPCRGDDDDDRVEHSAKVVKIIERVIMDLQDELDGSTFSDWILEDIVD